MLLQNLFKKKNTKNLLLVTEANLNLIFFIKNKQTNKKN